MLYQDMTSRDLLQQRTTLPSGDTAWRPSPLVTAAMEGSLAVLDGVHRVNTGTFAVLHRLIHDRELSLFDGSRLLRHDKYDAIKEKNSFSDAQMTERGVFRIHPSFRICALSEPPTLGSSTGQWLTSEVLTMFLFHHMRDLNQQEELQILNQLVPHLSNMQPILDLTHKMREAPDANLKSAATSLSTRQLLRIARRLAEYPSENLNETVHKACLSRFLPRLAQTALDEELEIVGLTSSSNKITELEKATTCEVKDGVLRIGSTTVDVHNAESKMKVPDVLFYENPQHLNVMEGMLKDFLLGEHLLLVGNQGVGKNKIIDRFLHLLNRPREYLQLHRDTTVQTLTLQPTVIDGVIKYEDSPLVRAVRLGQILVVDEADKAPTHVTCILKTLVESGEMHLADGRRIVHSDSGIPPSERVIVAHPDFRMFVLANRPGFPFLGNDFFGAMGDIFSCHAIDNPDPQSEMAMLRQYGPHVPDHVLEKLVLAFGELRDMADQGLITYPYSTREVVNMVKHLEKYPHEGLATVVKNVFDFDMYNKEITETVVEALHKHGIPIGANPNNVALAKEFPLPALRLEASWEVRRQGARKHTAVLQCPVEDKPLRVKGPVQMSVHSHQMDRTDTRSVKFTEQESFWTLPLHETSAIADVAVTKATVSPMCLYTMNPAKKQLTYIDLYDIFPSPQRRSVSYKPRIHLAPLGFPLDSTIIVHEEFSNITLSVNFETGQLSRLEVGSFVEATAEKISKNFRQQQGNFKICSTFSHEPDGIFLHYKQESGSITVFHMLEGRAYSIETPVKIQDIQMVSRYDWLITEAGSGDQYLLSHSKEQPLDFHLQGILDSASTKEGYRLELAAPVPLPDSHLSAALDQSIKSPNRILISNDAYASVAVGLPDLVRCSDVEMVNSSWPQLRSKLPVQYLPESGQVVRILATWQVPKEVYPDGQRPRDLSAYLEVTDLVNKHVRYVPIPGVMSNHVYNQWFYSGASSAEVGVVMAGMSHDGLVTVDNGGCVRTWQTALFYLDQSLKSWRNLIGEGEKELKVGVCLIREGSDFDPKFGKIDPTGSPHVGGGTWAGGSGGMNTAGLGGIGGPFRLDIGQDVHQIPDWQKEKLQSQMPEDVKRAAREMGQKAFKERLKQIKMSEYDAELYDRFMDGVQGQIKSLRIILDSLQAKGKERQWVRHQTHGDFDEAKLIEGLTGERAIYKRRGEKEPEMGSPQQKPKLVRLLCDVSGSMYRFNGHDSRLEREMEAMLMVMEGLESYEQKIKYDIVGHSGEGYKFNIVDSSKPPKNNKDRLDVLKTLQAHAQFCISGDHTLEATKHAIEDIIKEEADEHFVIVLSDANLDRYGIRPKHFAEILTSNEDVNAYVIFIGSLGNQANVIAKQMPAGRAFLCMDTKNLPQILQQIFTSTMLSSR
ncbi:hypothetical protein CAPTEDRAFT_192877 [Capitella teleta]|uniref:VWFA domain-containing protein n=1 Tax=Capitella teleta TaxID=283909 RepID=R7U6M6_CAPTE|nr:hypothetical protein CAPTEDRAFT_192877 [Capitella teleta]|eukprot:ELU02005.1 hypothetical protein CAPTEDRAFT_192877 [Capitella teleta]